MWYFPNSRRAEPFGADTDSSSDRQCRLSFINFCSISERSELGFHLMLIAGQIVIGLVLLVLGGELLVRGAASLAATFRISPLVIGLTVVAFGTSAPELGVSLKAALSGNDAVAVGNVIGSNIINVLFVLGSAAVVAPLVVNSSLIRKDVPLMIAASLAVWWMASDGKIERTEGIVLFVSLLVYLFHAVTGSRRESKASMEEFEDYAANVTSKRDIAVNLLLFVAGLAMLGYGANLLVEGATSIATDLGVSKLVVGLTVVAIGTSLPEVVTSVVASYRGQRDIAVGNVVGSNLFNLLCVLGLTASVSPKAIPVSANAIQFDFPVMVAVALVCFPIFLTGHTVRRWEGILFLFYYLMYTIVIVLVAKNIELESQFSSFVYFGVVPLTLLTFVASVVMSRASPSELDSIPADADATDAAVGGDGENASDN